VREYPQSIQRKVTRQLGIVLPALSVAVLGRMVLLGALETRIVWVTFYPAVVIASLFSGWPAGLSTVGAPCLIALYAWPLLVEQPFNNDYGDRLGMFAFAFNCVLISTMARLARRARQRSVRAQKHSEAANHAQSLFLANMSHELRTPLNGILGFSGLLRSDSTLPGEQHEQLEITSRSGEHPLDLINNVLDLARIEAGRSAVEGPSSDSPLMIRHIVDLMREPAKGKGIGFTLEMVEGLPSIVTTDESKLRQVVINLVSNAIKFTSQGGVTLRLSATGEPHQKTLLVEVVDTGEGIPPEERERIVEPFVQLGPESNQKGTGLGLSISRGFVELLGGTIRAEARAGRGSLFRIELPVATIESFPPIEPFERESRIARLTPGQPEYRILIVEDHEDNRRLLQRLMAQAVFQVRTAENGVEGIEIFRSWQPHLIWMDWRMPEMDGLEATRHIRALEGGDSVKIIALSASVLSDEQEKVLAAGADDFVPKPIQFGKIFDSIAGHLGVNFASEKLPAPLTKATPENFDREALAALPSTQRAELADALVSLEATRIAETINRIAGLDAELEEHWNTMRLCFTTRGSSGLSRRAQ